MNHILKKQKGLKFYQTLSVTFRKVATGTNKSDSDNEVERDDFVVEHHVKRQTAYFHSIVATITNDNQIKEVVNLSIQQILKKIRQWLS